MLEKTFQAKIDQLHPILQYISQYAKSKGVNEKVIKEIQLGVEEAFINIIQYAYQNQPKPIRLKLGFDKQKLKICLIDNGPSFNPLKHSHQKTNNDEGGGAGIKLIRSLLDDIEYQRIGSENHLTLTKNLP